MHGQARSAIARRNAGLPLVFRCKEHFESETPNTEGQSTHFTKGAVYRSSQLEEEEGKADGAVGDAAEPKPGPSGITGAAGRSSGKDEKRGASSKKKKKKKSKKQQARRSRGRSATTEDAWSRRPTRQRRRRATHCDYDSDDSVESSPERYREAKFKINGHILRKKPWLSLERRKSSENK